MVAGDHDDGRIRQARPHALHLLEEEENRRIRRPDRVEDVPREHDQIGALLEQVVDRAAERLGDVRLALIPAARRLPVELAESQVQVGEVRELHGQYGSSEIGFNGGTAWRSRGASDATRPPSTFRKYASTSSGCFCRTAARARRTSSSVRSAIKSFT